jgi:PAS domain S-box-containing protein
MVIESIELDGYAISELICSSHKHLIYRACRDSDRLPVIIKIINNFYPTFQELTQFRNEYIITKNLNGRGIIRSYSLETYGNGYALVMEDFEGISLSDYLLEHRLELAKFLVIAISLADILAELYQARIIHKDIQPANILINPKNQQLKLIDFSIASLLGKKTQTIQNLNAIEGNLAYLSPEQTGRMNRPIDYRTDFYSLGVTFYQLLTGRLPFESLDPIELVYCHLAKQPANLDEIEPKIPEILSKIIAKLMAKNAEDRYQNALGLKYDLEQCRARLSKTNQIEWFKIGTQDISDRFFIPEKLYGRETEITTLIESFDRVANGNSELILVAGYSGIGKTAIVKEIHKPIVKNRGYFLQGKFDQFIGTPLSAFLQAFRSSISQILSETDDVIKQWKSNFLKALGENARVIIDVIPELEKIIGSQPDIPKLSGIEVQNRFNLYFTKFIEVFTTKEHPLVIFLDDLQWADAVSRQLIQLLMSSSNKGYLLLIGAYRENEVSLIHPLMLTLDEIKKTRIIVNTISLPPLKQIELNQLIADTLKCSPSLAWSLTQLVYWKTEGNPFFVKQILNTAYEEGFIKFNFATNSWEWDLIKIGQLAITNNVIEFTIERIKKLPKTTQNVLKLAACIGNSFDLETLAIIYQKSPRETVEHLWEGLQVGLILPENEGYKFWQGDRDSWDSTAFIDNDYFQDQQYKFLHDRVQQAAYALIPGEQKEATHYQIGNLLLDNLSSEKWELYLFKIVNHLNIATSLVIQSGKRDKSIQLNLITGRKAREANAYSSAVSYFTKAIDLQNNDSWKTDYQLTLNLHQERLQAAAIDNNFERLVEWGKIILQNTTSILDKILVYEILIVQMRAQGEFNKAINIGLQVLKLLKISFPQQPTYQNIQITAKKTREFWQGKSPIDLLDLPPMNDAIQIARMQILTNLSASAFIANPPLLALLIFKQVELSLQHGNCPISIFAYADYGLLLCGMFDDIDAGYEFGQLALTLLERYNITQFQSRTYFIVNSFILHWKEPLKNCLPLLQTGYQSGLATGDWECVGLNLTTYSIYKYFAGDPLNELTAEIDRYGESISQIKQTETLKYYQLIQQTILNLVGQAKVPYYINGTVFNQEDTIPLLKAANNPTTLSFLYLNQAILNYLFRENDRAWQQLILAEGYINSLCGYFTLTVYSFYDALIHLARYSQVASEEQINIKQRVALQQQKLQFWASHAPFNHQHKWELVEAERYRILGQRAEALDYYDRAIDNAQKNQFLNEEALANELAARFYLEWGKEKVAAGYMQEAYYCYTRWGAKAKIDDLKTRYPRLLAPILQQQKLELNILSTFSASLPENIHSNYQIDRFDLVSILQAARSLSDNLEISDLIRRLFAIMLQTSGAEIVILLLPNQNHNLWQIYDNSHNSNLFDKSPLFILEDYSNIPIKLINQVRNRQERVIVNRAIVEPELLDDYFIEHHPQSILCLPMLDCGELRGILYLEHRDTADIFTWERQIILEFLASQAVITLNNAELYESVAQRSAAIEASLDGIAILENERFIYLNYSHAQMFNYSVSELIGRDWKCLYSPEQIEHFETKVFPLISTFGQWQGEAIAVRKDGTTFDEEVTLLLLENGQIICICRDISERKKAEIALQQSQHFIQQIADASPNILYLYDLEEQRNVYVNREISTILGYSPEEIQAMGANFLSSVMHPDDLLILPSKIAQLQAAQDGEILEMEYRMRHADGEWRWLSSRDAVFSRNANGRVKQTIGTVQDITDRKQAEEALKQQLAAIEASIDGIGILKNETYFYLNRSHLTLFGYEQPEELVGKTWRELYSAAEIQRFEREILPLLYRDRYWQGESIGTRQDGSTFVQELSLTLNDNDILVYVGRDITNRKRQENALKAIVEETVLKTGADFYQACTKKLAEIFDVRYAFVTRLLDYSDTKIQLLSFWNGSEFLPPCDVELASTPCLATLENFWGIFPHSVQKLFPEASLLTILNSESYLSVALQDFEGNLIGNMGVMDTKPLPQDTSTLEFILQLFANRVAAEMNRQADEDALRKNQQQLWDLSDRLSLAIKSAKIGIWEWEIESNLIVWDDGMYQLYGVEPTNFVPTYDFWLQSIHPDDRPRLLEDISAILVRAEDYNGEFQIVWSNGIIRRLKSHAIIQCNPNGDPIKLIGVNYDITELKQAERLLKEYNQTLEIEVADRTQQLSQALKELQLAQDQLVESRKMSALGTLVAGVAHEVNTPVGTSITVASSLVDKTSTLIAQVEQGQLKRADLNHYLNFARECSQMMLANLNRAAELVQNFKQVAVDTSQLDCRAICLVTYLKEVVFSLSPNFRHLGHQVTITGDETISIVTNSGALAQVVTNLTMNSIKHAYDEGTSGHLNFQVLQQKESVIIVYQDDGCGISPDNLKHIFEPFFTTARHRGGTGLGLHIVYNLVTQKLQGKIEVESQINQGTKFRLILPLKLFDT